jgi:hypothetical protein
MDFSSQRILLTDTGTEMCRNCRALNSAIISVRRPFRIFATTEGCFHPFGRERECHGREGFAGKRDARLLDERLSQHAACAILPRTHARPFRVTPACERILLSPFSPIRGVKISKWLKIKERVKEGLHYSRLNRAVYKQQ